MEPAPQGAFALHLLDVGQGESILLDLPGDDFALVDAGPKSSADVVLRAVGQRVEQGRRFRFAALTHWDVDHVGALPLVLQAHSPLELVRPNVDIHLLEELCAAYEQARPSQLATEVVRAAPEAEPRPLGARDEIRDVGDGVEIWALSPDRCVHSRLEAAARHPGLGRFRSLRNEASLVLWIRAFGRALLLPGELDADAARALEYHFGDHESPGLIHQADPRARWIKLSHHGASRGTHSELLRVFAHENFVASASHGAPHYGHPHPEALKAVHFDHGGLAMCTRLGRGCSLIIDDHDRYNPRIPTEWLSGVRWNDIPNPDRKCYGTVSVMVFPDGQMCVTGETTQPECPYGGPTGAVHWR